MEQALGRQPGVARVLGPDDSPFTDPEGIVLAEDGDAARFVVIFDSDPLAARAIDHVRELQGSVPGLARSAGLPDAEVTITGQTIIAAEVATLTRLSLEIVLVVALMIELIILVSLPAVPGGAGGPAGLQRAQRGRRARADHLALPGNPRRAGPDLLRPLRGGGAADRPRVGLQRLRRRTDLARGQAPAPGRGPVDRRAAVLARDHHRRPDPGRDLRPGGHHPALDVPPDRLRDDRRTAAGHPGRPADPDPGRADAPRTVRGLAGQAHPHRAGCVRRRAGRSGGPSDERRSPTPVAAAGGVSPWRRAGRCLSLLLLWGADALSGSERSPCWSATSRSHRRRRPPARRRRGRVFSPAGAARRLPGGGRECGRHPQRTVADRTGGCAALRRPGAVPRCRAPRHPPGRHRPLRRCDHPSVSRSQQLLRDHRAEVRLARTDDGQVQMRGFFSVLGQTVQATADVELSVDGNQLRITRATSTRRAPR